MANSSEEHDREAMLAENRARRAQIRADEAGKAEGKRDSAAVDTGETSTDVTDEEAASAAATGSRFGSRGVVAALAAVVVVLAVAVGVLGYLLATADSDDGSGVDDQAIADAKNYAVTVLTYSAGDYADLDKRIRSISTSEFADRYIKSSQQARTGNDEAKAKGVAEAKSAGLISISDSTAVVLVAVDQTVTTPLVPSAEPDGMKYQSRLQITLVRDGDEWKMSDLSVV
ncbi:hypothetical protein [Gordonia hydrophobica]|uniref:Mce-associated membrane protein n=1 Tax=Gordonia hydrophobica TaxID=40516 RepID=A0ABZ2TZ79_9ACTN|nr:hypothetical protein [Gordonia hydrophobica]MBM7367010.1 Mce-associated membrane protein [Gordonia hydrophobica]